MQKNSLRLGAFGRALTALALVFVSAEPILGTERHFTFTYETTTAANGEVELENWVTSHRIGKYEHVQP